MEGDPINLKEGRVNTFNDGNCPFEITNPILKIAAEEQILILGTDAAFKDTFGPLRLVCKNWREIIDHQIYKNRDKEVSQAAQKKNFWINAIISAYELFGYGDDCKKFLNGKLVYTPPHGNAPIELLITDLEKPFMGEFDLSKCGEAGRDFSISTGYRKEKKAENTNKIEIWFTPWFIINKVDTLVPLFGEWRRTKIPMVICWNGSWMDLGRYDFLISSSLSELTNVNLYELWEESYSTQLANDRAQSLERLRPIIKDIEHFKLSCSFCEPKLDLT